MFRRSSPRDPAPEPGNRVRLGEAWTPQLDRPCLDGQVRIRVDRWVDLGPVQGLHVQRRANLAQLLGYLGEVGPRQVVRKARSRLSEAPRHARILAVGTGTLLESRDGSWSAGRAVAFIAPCHPPLTERVVLDARLVAESPLPAPGGRDLLTARVQAPPEPLAALAGWSPSAGLPLPDPDAAHAAAAEVLRTRRWDRRHTRLDGPVRHRWIGPVDPARRSAPSLAVFGWGQYAKVVAVPHLTPTLRLGAIHDVDPGHLPEAVRPDLRLSTTPHLLDDEHPDVVLAAGFHHTHAPLAIQALERGAVAIIEKPPATTAAQLEALLEACAEHQGRVFVGYNRRYLDFNGLARQDLRVGAGEPIDYHCIVFEEPPPPRHWYLWPASGGRIICNGCHWIDHFLHLNPDAAIVHLAVQRHAASPHTGTVSMVLDSGASFTMVLTDEGSGRVGMREHIELRAKGRTVTLRDQRHYVAEGRTRVLRRARRSKLHAYRAMYRDIARRIVEDAPGEDLDRLARSTRAMLDVAEAWNLS